MKILPLLAPLLLMGVPPICGQAMVYALSGDSTPMPSSVRFVQASAWFTDDHPGVEGGFGLPTDDYNHAYVYHLNHWRMFALTTSTPTPTPTPTP